MPAPPQKCGRASVVLICEEVTRRRTRAGPRTRLTLLLSILRSCAASTRRYYHNHPSITPQLTGAGAPKPSETSNEEPLIKGTMRTFPDQHPSLGSVKNVVATGCPAIVHSQMNSDQWKSTTRATIDNREPTMPKRPDGKGQPAALFGAGELFTEPVEVYVAPPNAPPTIYVRPPAPNSASTLPAAPWPRTVAHARLLALDSRGDCQPWQRDQRVFKHMGTLTRAGQW